MKANLHLIFDTVVLIAIVWYLRNRLLQEIEWWRQRKHAEIEMERISAEAMEKLRGMPQ